jgi:capsular polysaccharide biosynthesis protein
VNESPKEYQILSLKAYGIDENCLEIQPERIHTKIERLWFASPLGHTGLTGASVLRSVSDKICKNIIENEPIPSGNGIYISRKFAANRRIINEESLLPVFKKFHIDVFYSEHHSFQEQVKKFYSARCIIGPHGAGLTNTMFSKPGSFIVELAAENMGIHYMTSCLGMGLNYQKMFCQFVQMDNFNSDMVANALEVEKLLLKHLGNK